MNVLVVSHMFPNSRDPAAGCFVAEQVKEIRSRCNVTVVAPLPAVPRPVRRLKRHWDAFWNTPFHETVGNLDVYRPRYFCLPKNASLLVDGISYRAATASTVDQIYQTFRFDILHVHGAVPDGHGVSLINRKYSLPIVLNIHGRDINKVVRMSPLHRQLVGRVLARVDTVITVSNKLKNRIQELFPHVEAPVVIHDGIDTTIFSPHIAKESAPRSNREPYLLTVGNLLIHKNHRAVISAVARLRETYPRIILKIAGAGPEEKNLRALCQSMGVSDIVEFLGVCSRERVRELMSECDIFVMPSWDEGFGIVYIEAMSQGKPVIASQGEGIADVITEGKTGFLVDPHDVDELTERIRQLADDKELAQRVGKAAQELVLREFTWQKNVDRLMEVYRELTRRTPV